MKLFLIYCIYFLSSTLMVSPSWASHPAFPPPGGQALPHAPIGPKPNAPAILPPLIREGNCGEGGCQNQSLNSGELLVAILQDSDVQEFLSGKDVQSIVKFSDLFFLHYQLSLDSGDVICVAIEMLELPMAIDGKHTVKVGTKNVLITPKEQRCQ